MARIVRDHSASYLRDQHLILAIGLLTRVILALVVTGRFYAGEMSQGPEMAYYMIHPERSFLVTFDFDIQLRSYLGPVIFFPIVWLGLQMGLQGLQIYVFLRFCMSLLSIVPIFTLRNLFDTSTESGKDANILAQWLVAAYFPLVVFSIYLTADALALTLLLVALPRLYHFDKLYGAANVRLGFLLGLVTGLRHPLILVFIPFGCLLFFRRRLWSLLQLLSGASGFAAIYGYLDYRFYGTPFISLWTFIRYNLLEQPEQLFGSQPWWFYPVLANLMVFGLGVLLIVSIHSIKEGWKTLSNEYLGSLLIGCGIYILAHQLLDHKEIRFLLPVLFLYLIISTVGMGLVYRKHPRGSKILLVFVIFYLVGSSMFAPYYKWGNVWTAQDYIHGTDPEADVMINTSSGKSGGYLLECGSAKVCGRLYFSTSIDSTVISGLLAKSDYVILVRDYGNWQLVKKEISSTCTHPQIVKLYEARSDILRSNSYLRDFYAEYDVELWSCN